MIKNKSKRTTLTDKFSFKNGFGKVKGLMLVNKPQALILKTRFGIHTFFLKFPIDLIVVDKNKQVVFAREGLKPNNIVFWNPKYNTVLELPCGSIKKSNTKLGDLLDF